jgi:hypothetical protein
MGRGMMLGKVVGEIVFTCTPMNNELALLDSVADPVEAHVYGFGSTLFDCLLEMPVAHALLVWMSVADCGWPISSSVMRRGAQSRAFWNTAPSSADVVDAMTFRMMGLMVWMAPFYGGGVAVGMGVADGSGSHELRKKVPPAQLLALASKSYEASLWIWR